VDRTDFFNEITVNSQQEYDYLDNSLSRFVMNYPVSYYRIQGQDIMRPDLISYKVYNTVDYWWIICYVNKIQNPLVDMTAGTLIKIPNTLDIYNFFKTYSYR